MGAYGIRLMVSKVVASTGYSVNMLSFASDIIMTRFTYSSWLMGGKWEIFYY